MYPAESAVEGYMPAGHMPLRNMPGYKYTYPGRYTGVQQGVYPGTYTEVLQGVYPGTHTGLQSEIYPGTYKGVQSGLYPGTYTGVPQELYPGTHTGVQSGIYPGAYKGVQPEIYSGTYTGTPQGVYTGTHTGVQSGIYPGAYKGVQPGIYPGTYTGVQQGLYPGTHTGVQSGVYPGTYTGVQPGMNPGTYTGVQSGVYPGGLKYINPAVYPGGYNYTYTYPAVYPGGYKYIYPGMYPTGYKYINPGMYPEGSVSGGYVPSEYMPFRNMSSGNMLSGNITGSVAGGYMPSLYMPFRNMSSGKMSSGDITEHMPPGNISAKKTEKSQQEKDIKNDDLRPTREVYPSYARVRRSHDVISPSDTKTSGKEKEGSMPEHLKYKETDLLHKEFPYKSDINFNLSSKNLSYETSSEIKTNNPAELSSVLKNVTEIASTTSGDVSRKSTSNGSSTYPETSSISIDSSLDDLKYSSLTLKLEDENKNRNSDIVSAPLLNINVTSVASNIIESNSSGAEENVTSDNLTTEIYSFITENSSNIQEKTLNNLKTHNEISAMQSDQNTVTMNVTLSPTTSINVTDGTSDYFLRFFFGRSHENVSVAKYSSTADKSTLNNSEGSLLSTKTIDDESTEKNLIQTTFTLPKVTSVLSTVTDNISMDTDNTDNDIYKAETIENVSGMNYRNHPLSTFETNSTVINDVSSSKVNTASNNSEIDNNKFETIENDSGMNYRKYPLSTVETNSTFIIQESSSKVNSESDSTISETYSPSIKEMANPYTYSYESSVSQENATFAAEVSSNASEISLQSNITDVATGDIYSETSQQSNITDLATSDINSEISLQSNITDLATSDIYSETSLQNNITDLATSDVYSETSLQSNITDLATSDIYSETSLHNNITDLARSDIYSETSLQSNITDLATSDIYSETSLQNNITDLATSDVYTETSLQSNITDLATSAVYSETSLQSNITDLATSDVYSETSLQSNITDLATSDVYSETSLQSNITDLATNDIYSATSLHSNITDLARSDIYSTSMSMKLNETFLNDSLVNNDHTESTKQKEKKNITDDLLNEELQTNVPDSVITENITSINNRREILDLEPHSLDTKYDSAENNTDDSDEMPGNIPTEFSIHIGKAGIISNNNTGSFETIVFNDDHSDWGIFKNTFLDGDNISDISNTSSHQHSDINGYEEPNTNTSSFLNSTYPPMQDTSASISRLLAVFNHSDEIFFRNADQDKSMGLELNGIIGPKDTEPISEYNVLSVDSNSSEFLNKNVTTIIKDKETAHAEKPNSYPLPFYLIKNPSFPNTFPKKINNDFANLNSATENNLENSTSFFRKVTGIPKSLSNNEFREVDTFSDLKYTNTPDEIGNDQSLRHQEIVNDLVVQPSYEKTLIDDTNDEKEGESPIIIHKGVVYGLISPLSPFSKSNAEKTSSETTITANSEREINDFSTISMRLNETEILDAYASNINQDLNVRDNKSMTNTLYHNETSSLGEFSEIFHSTTNMNQNSSELEEKTAKDTKMYYGTTASEIKENINVNEHENNTLKTFFSDGNITENYESNASSTAKQEELPGLTTLHSAQVSAHTVNLININISVSDNANMSQKDARFAKSLDNHISSFDQNSTVSNGHTNADKNQMKNPELPKAKVSPLSKLLELCPSARKRCNRRLLERCLMQLRNESDSNCNRISYDDVIVAADGRNPTNKERPLKEHSQRCFRRIKKSCSRETFDCIVDVFYVKEHKETALLMC